MTFSIHSHRWYPAGDVTQAQGVYLLHGVGEHAGRYQRLAQQLNDLGYVVGAHDHPGHGKSDGKRGVIDPEQSFVDHALNQLEEFIVETGAPPILFGHSLGGVVAATLVLQRKIVLAGLIMSAPGFVPLISRGNRIKLKVFNAIAPYHAQELPYDPTRLTHDKLEQENALKDPLIHGFKSASMIMWLIESGEAVLTCADQFHLPTLLLIPEDDPVIDSDQTVLFANTAPQDNLTVRRYPGFRHEILNETPERRDRVVADITGWLELLS